MCVKARTRVRNCASALDALACVCAADVLDPNTDPTDRWTIEVVVEHSTHLQTSGVPPAVLAALANHDLTVRGVTQQGAGSFSVVVATA
jgi:hypothetical protein